MADTSSLTQKVANAEGVAKDCILVVGSDKVDIQVNSVFLSAVSQPFRAMFAPEWRTGHAHKTSNGFQMKWLPDDDGTALQLICGVIHHESHAMPNEIPAQTVLRVAIMADKYDCCRALRYASESWLNPKRDVVDDLFILTAAAYLFDNATAFRQLTKKMILTYNGPFAAASWGGVEDMLDWKLLGGSPAPLYLYSCDLADASPQRSFGRRKRRCETRTGKHPHAGNYRRFWKLRARVRLVK